MSASQPAILSAGNKHRVFVTSAVAVQGIIIDESERILLLHKPNCEGGWEVISGALEAGETILEGVLRETREEAGPEVNVRPLGVIHAETFHYDENVRYMLGIHYLLAYEGGQVQPGDDMAGSEFRWWRLEELAEGTISFQPSTNFARLKRAVSLYRLWKDDRDFPLQQAID